MVFVHPWVGNTHEFNTKYKLLSICKIHTTETFTENKTFFKWFFFFFHFCIVEIKRKREETKKYRTRASIKFVLWIAEDLQSYRVHNPPLIFNGIFECFVWFTILIHLVNTHFCVGPVKWDCFFCTARSRCISLIVNNTKWWHCLLSVIPFESQIESELFKMWGGICFPFRWLSLVIMIAAISKSFDWNPDTELKWSCNYHKLC